MEKNVNEKRTENDLWIRLKARMCYTKKTKLKEHAKVLLVVSPAVPVRKHHKTRLCKSFWVVVPEYLAKKSNS